MVARRIVITAVIVLAVLSIHGLWDQLEANRLSRAVQAIQSRGEPVDSSDRRRPLANDEQRDASRLYFAAAILAAPRIPESLQPKAGERANVRETIASVLGDLAERPSAKVREEPRLDPLTSIVKSAQPAFDLLDRATPLDFQRFSPDLPAHSMLSADLLQLAAVNSLRTDVQMLRGEYADAARSHVASMRLQRTLRGALGGFLPGTTGSLRLLLAHAALDDHSLQLLQHAYGEVANDDGVADSLIDQRVLLLESVWPHATGRPSWAQRLDGRGIGVGRRMSETAFLVLRPWLTRRVVEGLAVLQRRIELARLPWPQKFAAAQALGQGVPEPAREPAGAESQSTGLSTPFPSLTAQGVPAFVRSVTTGGERLALNRVMLAALAVERYRRAHHEALPPTLEAVVPDYLDRVPVDPFDGAPLRFTRTADGYAIYSIGPDARDDGGDLGEWVSDIRPAGPNVPVPRDRGIRVPLHPIQ